VLIDKFKFIFLLIILIVSTAIGLFFWDKIILSPDKYLVGYDAIPIKNYHPQTDTVRFFFFILISLIPFYISFLNFYKNKLLNIKQIVNLECSSDKNYIHNIFNYLFFFIIIAVIFDFLLINFDDLIHSFDIHHEGVWLTASSNYVFTKGFWSSSFVERGLFGNFYPLILWSFFDNNNSIGLSRLGSLILLLSNKLLLIILAKQIVSNIQLEKFEKLFFFLFLSIIFLSFVDYYDTSHFSTRYPLFILFFNILFISIQDQNRITIANILIGFFSILSILWMLDIGIFINLIIFLIILFSFVRKEYLKIFSISMGIFLGWTIFFFIFPENELRDFFSNTTRIFSTMEIGNQLPYPSPLFGDDGRATKTLIFFVLAGVLTIYSCFYKNKRISNKLKIFYIFLYLASLISFKYGLGRSDSLHIQSSTGLLLVLLSSLTLYYFINFLNYLKINLFLLNFRKINFILILLIIFFQFDLYKLNHIINFPDKLRTFIYADDKEFFTGNFKSYNKLIAYYKKISSEHECIQILTDEAALPFLLKKKSCTKFYIMNLMKTNKSQNNLIDELKLKKPKIILYKSEKFDFGNISALKIIDEYVEENYVFHSKFDLWTFFKIK
jgi:hypothetical protein